MSLTILRKVSVTGGTVLRAANNLGDVASLPTTLINLGVPQMRNALATAQALAFGGTAGADIANMPSVVTDMTIAVSLNQSAAKTATIICNSLDALIAVSDGSLRWYSNNVQRLSVASAITYGVTDHFTLVRGSGVVTLYRNGVSIGTAADTETSTLALVKLGAATDNSQAFNGVLKLVGIVNRAHSAAEALSVYQSNALLPVDLYGSGVNTTITSGAFVVGRKYRILVVGTTDFTLIGASANTIGVEFTATGVGIGTGTATAIGALIAPEANAPGNGYQLRDTSGNKADITIPATGVDWLLKNESGPFQVRATLTWAGTHEAKSLLGQIALPTKAVITSIITEATVASSGSGLTVGSVTTPALWVALNTFTTARKVHTLAASGLPAGTATNDISIVLDPDTANYTGTIQVWVNYVVTN